MKTLVQIITVLLLSTFLPPGSITRLSPARLGVAAVNTYKVPHETVAPPAVWKDIPVLCYHKISDNAKPGDYSISTQRFKEHIRLLADSGYHAIVPDQLYNFLRSGGPLPTRPVMITFDDSHIEHYTIAAPVLERYGFRGVFFIMSVTIGKPGYLSKDEIRSLSDRGHVIGLHTWDHQLVRILDEKGWDTQVTKPKAQLESITGKPVVYFAYPSGVWNENAIIELKRRYVKAAFQLYGKHSINDKMYTIRRIIVPGSWTAQHLQRDMKLVFH